MLLVNQLFKDERLKGVKKVEWKEIGNIPYYYVYINSLNKPILVKANIPDTVWIDTITKDDIKAELIRKQPGLLYETEVLTETDSYINFRKTGNYPLLKVVLNDANKTWLYFNLGKAEFQYLSNSNTRLRRWLYKGVHSFDIKFLQQHEWLRKLLLILLSVFGTIISISGIILSYNYLRRKYRRFTR